MTTVDMLHPRQNYDILLREENNICSVAGLLVAARDVLRLVRSGLFFAGVPCSSRLD